METAAIEPLEFTPERQKAEKELLVADVLEEEAVLWKN